MNKHNLLRAALVASIPGLATDPDKLRMWVEDGGIVARACLGNTNQAFEWRYTLRVDLIDFTLHPALLVLAINQWLAVQQPDLLTSAKTPAYTFEIDVIDEKTVDIGFKLALSEAVQVVKRPDGGYDLTPFPEPDPLFADALGFTPAEPIPLSEIWHDGERILPGPPLPLEPGP